MCLRRPDVWPHGDQALATAARELFGLATQPSFDTSSSGSAWQHFRATAEDQRHYLSVRGRG
jgi:3-methyladenine DNA glycosylase/8-oxoguanine DNA glycosylase